MEGYGEAIARRELLCWVYIWIEKEVGKVDIVESRVLTRGYSHPLD